MICHKCKSKNIGYNGKQYEGHDIRMCVKCRTEYILVNDIWEKLEQENKR